MRLNNKGSISGTIFAWVFRMLFLLVIMIVIYSIISINLSRSIETNDIQYEIIKSRLLYGSGCINYADKNRDYPGIIDLNKLDSSSFEKCFDKTKIFGMNLTLKSSESIKSTSYYNKDVYDLKFSCKLNKPKYNCLESSNYVLYKDSNGDLIPGILIIDLVMSK